MRRGEYGRESPSSWSAVGSRLVPPRLHQKYAHAQYNNNKVELASILTGRARRFVEGGKLPPTGVALKVGPPRASLFEIYPVNRGTPMPTWGGDCASTADPLGSLAGICSWTGQQQGARRRGRVPASVPLAKGKLALQKKKNTSCTYMRFHAVGREVYVCPYIPMHSLQLAHWHARLRVPPQPQRGSEASHVQSISLSLTTF